MPHLEPDLEAFPYGVASFEPTTGSVLLWTRTTGGGPLQWEVATDLDFSNVVASGTSVGEADDAERTHVVDVTDLAPGTDHHYRFTGESGRSPAGRTRTLADGDRPIRLGLACCGDYSAGHFAAYRALADADVDLVVHLGDYVYAEVEGDLRAVEPAGPAVSRADYRSRYAQVRRDPDLQALHQRHPMLAVIDDHDLADNAWEGGAKTHDPEEHGPWEPRRDAAAAERVTWLPIRTDGPVDRGERAQWRAVRLGDVAELVLLDTRLAGRDQQADDGGPALEAVERTILGGPQRRWLGERIRDRRAPWTLIVSSVVVNDMAMELPGGADVDEPFPAGYLVAEGRAVNTDGWDGYPAERRRLVDALRRRGGGAVLLSGDVHSAWAFEGPSDEHGAVAVELTCPAVTSEPMGEMIPLVGRGVQHVMRAKDDVRWADLFARGHLVVEVTPTSVTGTWWFSDSEDPSATAHPGATWRTHIDAPGCLEEVEVDPAAASPLGDRGGRRARPEPVPPRPPQIRAAAARRRRRVRVLGAAAAALVAVRWSDAQRG
ncbi:alkaline phosphatase [soil metagenome]